MMSAEAKAYYELFDKVVFRKNKTRFDCQTCGFVGFAPAKVDLEGEISATCPGCGNGWYLGEVGKIELLEDDEVASP